MSAWGSVGGRLAKPPPPATGFRSPLARPTSKRICDQGVLARRTAGRSGGRSCHDERWRSIAKLSSFFTREFGRTVVSGAGGRMRTQGFSEWARGRSPGDETSGPGSICGSVVTTIDFRTDPVTARRHRLGRRRDGLLTRCGAEMLRAIGSSWSGLVRSGSSARRGDHARS